jgi:hypothetical protein
MLCWLAPRGIGDAGHARDCHRATHKRFQPEHTAENRACEENQSWRDVLSADHRLVLPL